MTNEAQRLVEGALFTDQYELTMAQLYWRQGLHERPARFDYTFRSYPDYGKHQAGYCVAAGLGWLLDWVDSVRFTADDLVHLRSQQTGTGVPRFDEGFLRWLGSSGGFGAVEIKAVAEGRVVHPYAPIVTVEGPLATCQILETSLLNHLNYATLVATKASRVAAAARGGTVLEFGMRRGPGFGANAGSRAALIGGAHFSSNVGLSHLVGIPPKGTHAHSLVQAFMALGGGELEAFEAFAAAYPDECLLLVDTVDTLNSGVPNAIRVFEQLRTQGHQPLGIRLDSGDLAYLAVQSARLLDDAGFPDVGIVLSSNLDELAIWQILSQIEDEAPQYGIDPQALARRLTYGVGTRLMSSQGHPALDGVYKLVGIQDDSARWVPAIKVSEDRAKLPIPGRKRVWRLYDTRGSATADVVAGPDENITPGVGLTLHHPYQSGLARALETGQLAEVEELLVPMWRDGSRLDDGSVETARSRRAADVARLDPGVRRLVNPHIYHVSLTDAVKQLQDDLVAAAKRPNPSDG